MHVTAFRNQDWCWNLAYERGNFSFADDATDADTCNLFEGDGLPFDDQASRDFGSVADALRKTDLDVRLADYIEYDADGRVTAASFDLVGFGFSGDRRYIYDPGAPLPKNFRGRV